MGVLKARVGGVWVDVTGSDVASKTPTRQVFSTVGSAVWTKPAGLAYAEVEIVGGGGGGGGAGAAAANQHANGGGGASGGYVKHLFLASALGATETLTVGAGGAGGTAAGGIGGNSGTTSFSSGANLLRAYGGDGGQGSISDPASYGLPGGAAGGGAGPTGCIVAPGAPGEMSFGSGGFATSGAGGSSALGGGGVGKALGSYGYAVPGSAGSGYGAGGSGAVATSSSGVGAVGGAGTSGAVIITEYYAAGTGGSSGGSSSSSLGGNPVGTICQWPTATPPSGYLVCDGSTFQSTTYPELAALVGDIYGTHAGTTYYLPDFRGRSPLGVGSAVPDQGSGYSFSLGMKWGEDKHTLVNAEIPNVQGTIDAHAGYSNFWSPGGAFSGSSIAANYSNQNAANPNASSVGQIRFNNSGGGGSHNNIHSILAVHFIIKATSAAPALSNVPIESWQGTASTNTVATTTTWVDMAGSAVGVPVTSLADKFLVTVSADVDAAVAGATGIVSVMIGGVDKGWIPFSLAAGERTGVSHTQIVTGLTPGLTDFHIRLSNLSGNGQVRAYSGSKIAIVKLASSSVSPATTVATSTTRPGSPIKGDQVYETDTKLSYVYTGGAWGPTIPDRLSETAATVGDWNNAVTSGVYMAAGAANAPVASIWFIGTVIAHLPSYVTQEVWNFTNVAASPGTERYRRYSNGGTWSAWKKIHEDDDRGWITANLNTGSGFSHYDTTGYGPARYRLKNGVVFLNGLINATTATNATFFTLPPGYRPNRVHLFSALTGTGPTRLDVNANGEVAMLACAVGWNSITCSFVADQ